MCMAKKSYKELRTELDDLMSWFDGDDIDVEQALTKYEQAEQIIKELEAYLKETELKITKLKA
jgi:exodeoxyribonuclease VII small subunit